MMFSRQILAVLGAATLLSGCGQPVCVAGIGNCDAYRLNPSGSQPGGTRVSYTLTANPTSVGIGGAGTTLSLTSNSTTAITGSCDWDKNGTGSVGGQINPDSKPMVQGALCTAQFIGTTAGTAIVQVKEKTSGVSTQVTIMVR